MLNAAEKRILHGLYVFRSRIGESRTYSAFELNWLAHQPYSAAAAWREGAGLQERRLDGISEQDEIEIQTGEAAAALEHLFGARLIDYTFATGALFHFNVEITYDGAMMARRLHTPWGRFGVWYSEHKDGVIGLLITMLVSALTSLLVAYITRGK